MYRTPGVATDGFRFNLNGLYAPQYPSGGHQPMGFDQLCPTLYQKYRVYKCAWTIKVNSAATTGVAYNCTVVPMNNQTAALTSTQNYMEIPRAQNVLHSLHNGKIIRGSIRLPNLVGRTTAEYMADDVYVGSATANPGEYCILHVWNEDTSGANIGYYFNIDLTYYCEFFDPNQPAQS